MSDIRDWLKLHGLVDYEALFQQHRIDLDTLSSINESDLKELAIPLGDRKKILKAISAHLRWNPSEKLASGQFNPASDSERRLLVVLFCDLVGSTEYATSLDPEDLASIFHTYRMTVKSVIEKHRGLTLIYEGDGIKAYFGSRIASEDEQEQTLAAALEIVETVSQLNLEHAKNLEVRIGVATGTVIIGDFDSPTGPNAFGEPMHLAARLQSLAEPGSILVDQATYRSMKSVFDFQDQGAHELKGYDKRVQAWKVAGKKEIGSRFAKRYRNTSLVGRQSEIETLTRYWNSTRDLRRGSVVMVTGEAGIGKSRLAHELHNLVKKEHCKSLLFQCSPYHIDSVYYPVLETIAAELGFTDKVSRREKHERLKVFLSGFNIPMEQSLPVFLNLFSLIGDSDYVESDLSESLQEDISKKVLATYILGLTEHTPLFVLVEDIQWIDATSYDFFVHLSDLSENYPLLSVFTSRESESIGSKKVEIESIELNRLTTDESKMLLDELFLERHVPAEFQAYVERKAEGIPLFIEELSSTIVDTGLKEREVEFSAADGSNLKMSGILESSLLSKLDRLGESKEIALLAATIGREFNTDVLKGISTVSPEMLRESLDRLLDAEIIFETKNSAGQNYYFKHALIQDTARNLLSRERKETTHRRIAEVLEHGSPGMENTEPELVALHYSEGRDFLKASQYWYTAGTKTAKTWAKKEALQLMQKGLEALFKTPESNSRLKSELGFQQEIGDILYATYGYITEQGEVAYLRALELCDQLQNHDASVRALDGLFGMHFNTCHFDETIRISDRLIALGEEHGNVSALVLGMQFKGMSLFCRGEFIAADELLTRALTFINRADEVGSDFPSMALIYLSWARYICDRPGSAIKCYTEALSIVQVQTPYRKVACLGDGCILFALMDKPEKVDELVRELIPLVERYGFNLWLNMARFFKGWATSRKGDRKGLEEMEQMMSSFGGQEIDVTFYLGLLASTYIDFEEYGKAEKTIEAGLSQARASGEHYYLAELLRLKAALELKAGGDRLQGKSLLADAASCAKTQAATSWSKRAALDMAAV